MPYKHEYLKLKLPKSLDRRVKYTEADKQEVRDLFKGGMSQRAINRETGISRRYINFILFPERLKRCNAQFSERRKDGRYYNKEANTKATRNTREHKQKYFNNLIS